MRPSTTLREALSDPDLLGHMLSGDSWAPWRVLLIAALGEELTEDERVIFRQFTGREHEPGQRVAEVEFIIGRRGGKSTAEGVLAAYIAGLCSHKDVLAPGEKGVLLCVATDQRAATIVLDRCAAAFEGSPILSQLIASRTSDTLELTNGVSIEVRPASFRRLRGPTYIAVFCDEVAFWYSEATYANPDTEILNAVRPGLLTTRGPLILASSPYAKRGVLYDVYKRHYGPDGNPSILVAKGTSAEFNATLPAAEIERALEADPARNSAEYLAEFRSDIEGFVALEVVEQCVGDYYEQHPALANSYFGFVDPAGGSGQDSFTLAISHRVDERVIIDCIREIRPPFSPEGVIEELVGTLKAFGIYTITGDRWAGEFPREQFQKRGIAYETSELIKSDLYRELLPLLNSGHIVLPRHDRLVAQLTGLERTTARGSGREKIDHGIGGHDDVANAVAGAAVLAAEGTYDITARWMSGPWPDDAQTPEERLAAADAQSAREQQWLVDRHFAQQLGLRNYFNARR